MAIKVFADVGTWDDLVLYAGDPTINGFTTNPSLLRKGGIKNYKDFAIKAANLVYPRPISFEVFANTDSEVYEQAKIISLWADNIYVKIPIINPDGHSFWAVLTKCINSQIKINVTGVFTIQQIESLRTVLWGRHSQKIVSIFAGRIADTGVDPSTILTYAKLHFQSCKNTEVLWASTRELYNIIDAEKAGCDIITISPDILAKRHLLGKDLAEYSAETIQQFNKDAVEAGFTINE